MFHLLSIYSYINKYMFIYIIYIFIYIHTIYIYLYLSLLFLQNGSIFLICFLKMFSLTITLFKKFINSLVPLLGTILRYLWAHFGICSTRAVTIAVKKYARIDTKVFLSCPILMDFFTFF